MRKRELGELSEEEEQEEKEEPKKNEKKKKKHRTIKDVIEIVLAWKRFKKGIQNSEGKIVKFTPQEAAEILGVSYKTLYDYMFFLK